MVRAERWTGSRKRWSGIRAPPSQLRQKRTVAAILASAASMSLRPGQLLGPGERAERLPSGLEDVPAAHAVALDAEGQVRAQADRDARPGAVGRVPVVLLHRPLRRCPPVVERRLAHELDLDVAVEALDRAHEQVIGVVVCGRPGVRRDLVLVVPRVPWSGHREPRSSRTASSTSSPARSSPARRFGSSDAGSRRGRSGTSRPGGRAGSRRCSASRRRARTTSRWPRPAPPGPRCGSRRGRRSQRSAGTATARRRSPAPGRAQPSSVDGVARPRSRRHPRATPAAVPGDQGVGLGRAPRALGVGVHRWR